MLTPARFAVSLVLAVAPLAQPTCVWGSFDASRIQFPTSYVLTTGTQMVRLRTALQSTGAALAPATPVLTAGYLSTVQVFFTSRLHDPNGTLSPAEQTALRSWISAGGTLVVSGDVTALAAYDSFTGFYGVTSWRLIGNCNPPNGSLARKVASHNPLTDGFMSFYYCGNSDFTFGANARLLVTDGLTTNRPLMVVLEPATGFTAGGRIVVLGSHSVFADGWFEPGLAYGIARWSGCCSPAAWSNFGNGWPGTNGVPALTASGNPVLGSTINVLFGNSAGVATAGVLLGDAVAGSFASGFGGTLLVFPYYPVPVMVPAGGISLPVPVPTNLFLCGRSVYFQALQLDAGASHGVSFTRGLDLRIGR